MLEHDTATSFATRLGVSSQRYSVYENGKFLSRDMAFQIKSIVPGITLDWLFYGDAAGLPLELARRLGELDGPGKRSTPP